jgi:hypothetical protein
MKSKVLDRPMFKGGKMDPDEVGIMSILMGEDDDMGEDEDESDMAKLMDRRPDSPEILMNNLRGDVRSIDARFEELADMVGYDAAQQTPPEVLALLQPVLAAEQQGIAALPAMAPGAAPAAIPTPPPPMAAPAGPGLPPGAAPPEAAGIGSLPMGMAKGGPVVQRFRNGSSERAVESMDNEPSETSDIAQVLEGLRGNMTQEQAKALYGSDFVERARQAALKRMEPYPVPKFENVLKEKIPFYQGLLGQDKSLTQAQMLFDIAGAGLALAGNVDPRTGQPMRGSLASRIAGAASQLPAQIGARASEAEKMAQQIKMLGIQAAEKEVSAARTEALAREKGLADFFGKLVPKTGAGANKPVIREIAGEVRVYDPAKGGDITSPSSWISLGKKPASGFSESDFNQFRTEYAPAILDGTATAEQKRNFLSAVTDYTQARWVPTTRTETNPTTKETYLVQKMEEIPGKKLDEIQQRALNKLRAEMGKDFNSVLKQSAAITPDRAPQEPAATTTGGSAASTTGTARVPTTGGSAAPAAPAVASTTAQGPRTASGTTTTPLFTQPAAQSNVNFRFGIQGSGMTPQAALSSGTVVPTIMDITSMGLSTGIISVPAAAITSVPAMGQFAPGEQQAVAYARQAIPLISRSLLDADRVTVTELQMKEKELESLLPTIRTNPTAAGRELLALDSTLAAREMSLKNKINNPDLAIDLKNGYRDRLSDVQAARNVLGVRDTPRFSTIDQMESYIKGSPKGSPIYFYFMPDDRTLKGYTDDAGKKVPGLNPADARRFRENPFVVINR